jgi:hypothetical protein
LIAEYSLQDLLQVGLLRAASEKKGGQYQPSLPAVHSLQSGLASKNRDKWAESAHLAENKGVNSLQFRLYGGARSLALTFLRQTSLLTGKITGNFENFTLQNRTPLLQVAHSAREIARRAQIVTGN